MQFPQYLFNSSDMVVHLKRCLVVWHYMRMFLLHCMWRLLFLYHPTEKPLAETKLHCYTLLSNTVVLCLHKDGIIVN